MDDLSRTVDELSVEEGETDATLEDYNMPLLEAECDAQLKGVITESARRTLRAGLQQGLSMEQTRSCVIRALETFIECANSTTNQVDDLRYETDFLEHISTSGDNKVEQDFLTFVSGVFVTIFISPARGRLLTRLLCNLGSRSPRKQRERSKLPCQRTDPSLSIWPRCIARWRSPTLRSWPRWRMMGWCRAQG